MRILTDILHLFFPKICLSCDVVLTQNEKSICTFCYHDLPVTDFTLNNDTSVLEVFYGRIDLEKATALLYFHKKGLVQNLIHNLKYKGQEEVGTLLGIWLGNLMQESKQYNDIDYIIPVPLHEKRMYDRGYNQVTKFGKELSKAINTPYLPEILIRKTASKTQTNKKRMDRWKNVTEIFYLTDCKLFENKKILLIDDIITTGATIEACSKELLKTKNIKLCVAVMAITI